MENTKEQIITKLQGVNIANEDLDIWKQILNELDEARIGDIFEFIQMTPESPLILNGNMKKKYNALKNLDFDAWNNILEKEQKIINNLAI